MDLQNTVFFYYYIGISIVVAIFIAVIIQVMLGEYVEPCFEQKYVEAYDSDSSKEAEEAEEGEEGEATEESPGEGEATEESPGEGEATEESPGEVTTTKESPEEGEATKDASNIDEAIVDIILSNNKGKTAKEIHKKLREIYPNIKKQTINSRLYTFLKMKLLKKSDTSVPIWSCS